MSARIGTAPAAGDVMGWGPSSSGKNYGLDSTGRDYGREHGRAHACDLFFPLQQDVSRDESCWFRVLRVNASAAAGAARVGFCCVVAEPRGAKLVWP